MKINKSKEKLELDKQSLEILIALLSHLIETYTPWKAEQRVHAREMLECLRLAMFPVKERKENAAD